MSRPEVDETMDQGEMIEVVAHDGRGNSMVRTGPDRGLSPMQLAERAIREWEENFEHCYSDTEGLRATGDGFRITVTVQGLTFSAQMRPTITWVVEAALKVT